VNAQWMRMRRSEKASRPLPADRRSVSRSTEVSGIVSYEEKKDLRTKVGAMVTTTRSIKCRWVTCRRHDVKTAAPPSTMTLSIPFCFTTPARRHQGKGIIMYPQQQQRYPAQRTKGVAKIDVVAAVFSFCCVALEHLSTQRLECVLPLY
jgi:hypothetical protein